MMELKETEDAWYFELLTTTPVDTPVKSKDDTVDLGTGAFPEGEGSSKVVSPGEKHTVFWCGSPVMWTRCPHWM